jgi:ABC-type Fe3+-siderophore transport system permease subunit
MNVLYSNSDRIPRYKILEKSDWNVIGDTTMAGEDYHIAKDAMLAKAAAIGANAVINVKYMTAVGKDKNYRYTLHYYSGQAVYVESESKNESGSVIPNMNKAAKQLVNSTRSKKTLTGLALYIGLAISVALVQAIIPNDTPNNVRGLIGGGTFLIAALFAIKKYSYCCNYVLNGYENISKK